jgi:hypothetical protein
MGISTRFLGVVARLVSWSDAQVVASVKTGSQSGFVQLRQNGNSSNTIPFTVNTPTITGISPTTGNAGTQVVISGSGFGATQGSGQVWLVVIETGAYDQPGPGLKNYVGYYRLQGAVSSGWRQYLQFIQKSLGAQQGSHLRSSLGGIQLVFTSPGQFDPNALFDGYWDYWGDFTSYILNNVCESTSCN